MTELTLEILKEQASRYASILSQTDVPELYGVTDGKAVGTYVESEFRRELTRSYTFEEGNAASGIDFPSLDVDMKVTSVRQPQSSCPFRSAEQKVFGLGYHLLVFVYDKLDSLATETTRLDIQDAVFIHQSRTADYRTTRGIIDILNIGGNIDDLIAFAEERNLPLDEIGRRRLAERIVNTPPIQGYLTISNALQWRLQYRRVVTLAREGNTLGVEDLLRTLD